MLLEGLFKYTKVPLLTQSLHASMLRQRVHANNIANVNTVGYRRLEVKFEEELRRALAGREISGLTTNPKHFAVGRQRVPELEPKVYQPEDPEIPSGVNNVDIEQEMAQLAKNYLLYLAATKFVRGNFSHLKSAIRGRAV